MENIKQIIFLSLMIIWCLSSLGIPLLAGSYVSWLGITFRGIQTAGSTKNPRLIDLKTGKTINANTEFESNVLESKNYHYMMGMGPFGILHGILFAGVSTYNLIAGK